MATRRTRTQTTESVSRVSSVLGNRRNRVQRSIEERRETARASDEQIIPCPTDQRLLSDLIKTAKNDVRHRRAGDYLHVSDLLTKCQRKDAIIHKYDLRYRVERLSLADALTFAQGDAIHDVVKERTGVAAPNTIWGKWRCKCGHLYHDEPCLLSQVDLDDVCPHCEMPTTEYVEVSMYNDEYMVVGNPDLLLYLRDIDAFHIAELKSIAPDQFKELTRPKPEHVLQVLFYWFLMRALGYRLTDMLSIFYVNKGYMFVGEPFQEFMIHAPTELHRLDDYLDAARERKIAMEGGDLPPRVFCAGEDSRDARACEVANICFGGGNGEVQKINISGLFAGSKKSAPVPARSSRRR